MIPTEWVERLFSRLTAMYGENKMGSMWAGELPQAEVLNCWQEGLAGISGAQIGAALQIVCREHPSWPPTLGEFQALCQRFKPADPIHRELPKLPAPRTRFDPNVKTVLERVDIGGAHRKDPKRWAREILRDAEAGTYRMHLGIQYAREALGMSAHRQPGEEG